MKPGEKLTFQQSGLTVIYGDNGAGKSGYARVLKHACRARRPKGDTVLPNICADDQGVPRATIDFCAGGRDQSFAWTQDAPAAPDLQAISVFDSGTATVHVDAENQLAYTPRPLKILEGLAGACDTLKERLNAEIKALEDQRLAILEKPSCAPGTKVDQLLKNLSAKIDTQEVEVLARLSKEEEARLNGLKADLASDPASAARRLRDLKASAENAAARARTLANAVQDNEIDQLRRLRKALDDASRAALLAAGELFSGEPAAQGRIRCLARALGRGAAIFNAGRLSGPAISVDGSGGAMRSLPSGTEPGSFRQASPFRGVYCRSKQEVRG